MWHYPQFDPIAIAIGPLAIHWYAISYLVGIGLVWGVLKIRSQRQGLGWSDEVLSDLVFYAVLGVIVGGRVGYMLFYGFENLIDHPLSVFKIWQGGMSFHGGMLGVIAGVYWFSRRPGRTFFGTMDFIAPAIPLALGCGRIGNFINAELPGRVAEVPWAVIYPGDTMGRHPSSLYQAFLEGVVLFGVLWWYSAKPRPRMAVSGMFLIGYGLLRTVSEFFRAPDAHLGFVALGSMTMGQILSVPMIMVGTALVVMSVYRKRTE